MILWPIVLLAFAAEFVDSSLGMGYGTSLTPILLLLGYNPLQVVPAVLLSELITGLLSAFCHHRVGNARFHRQGKDLRVAVVLGAMSIIGTLVAVGLAIQLPVQAVKIYIALLVFTMGIIILWRRNRKSCFSWGRLMGIGVLAAFNKGISGGGYGPLVTAGQITSGVKAKSAVAVTSLAEGLTCAVGVILYLAIGREISWNLAPSLLLGAILSVPLAAWAVKRIPERSFTLVIGVAVLVLGLLSLARVIIS